MVDAGDGADHRAVLVAHRQQILHRRHVLMVVPDHVDAGRHHAAAHVDAIHGVGIDRVVESAHRDAQRRRRKVFRLGGETQPVGVAGVDEQLGGRLGDDDVGFAGVDADVAAPGPLAAQRFDQFLRMGEGLPEYQPAPTQFELDVLGHRVDQFGRRCVVQAERDRLGVVAGRIDHGHATGPVTPWRCSQSSSSAICQSSLPRSGVSLPLGLASSASTASVLNRPRSLAVGA